MGNGVDPDELAAAVCDDAEELERRRWPERTSVRTRPTALGACGDGVTSLFCTFRTAVGIADDLVGSLGEVGLGGGAQGMRWGVTGQRTGMWRGVARPSLRVAS